MELKSLAAKNQFIADKKTLTVPKTTRVKTPSLEKPPIKILMYGDWGSGKTRSIFDLILLGYKVLVITTDLGGSGLATVIGEAQRAGKKDLLNQQLREVELFNYEEVKEFLENPTKYFPDIYDYDPDFVYWDGFSSFQNVDVSEEVGSMAESGIADKRKDDASEAVVKGVQFEKVHWGQIQNITLRALGGFCSLHNKKTGKIWHKVVLCHEDANQLPLVQGRAGKLLGSAFDIIIRTVKKPAFKYVTDIEASKVRGINLPGVMDPNFGTVWGEVMKQLGCEMGATNPEFVEEVPLSPQELADLEYRKMVVKL